MASRYAAARASRALEWRPLAEVAQQAALERRLADGALRAAAHTPEALIGGLDREAVRMLVTAGMACSALHTESRVASAVGEGFYTIGPCGEEALGAAALALRPDDAVALHYRHLAVSVVRQLRAGKSLGEVLLDRARAHCVSSLDPVTRAGHCALGGGPHDFLVTSTLASQAPPALGRALGGRLAARLGVTSPLREDGVSYVSVGDGSVNNAHFLSAANMACYAQHRGADTPVVFGVSDNKLCISLKGYGWLGTFLRKLGMPVFEADGGAMGSVYEQTAAAMEYARAGGGPACVLYANVPRRFGHAGSDRQLAYLTATEVEAAAETSPLEVHMAAALEAGHFELRELQELSRDIIERTGAAFERAADEPKLSSREELIARNSAPLAKAPAPRRQRRRPAASNKAKAKWRGAVMRKHMSAVLDETLKAHSHAVYLGEDVEHGGYYLVTEGLAKAHPGRVRDWPPDETTLLGAGVGFSQAGLLPLVEIPYAKYLDCGADTFFELAFANWMSAGKQPNGMVIRLQGFDRGLFGGNFHTHNQLHIPPGVDVVCYSNGRDYVRGMRYLVRQAQAGRVCMSVDSTALLNLRHLHGEDNGWRTAYPEELSDERDFDEVTIYAPAEVVDSDSDSDSDSDNEGGATCIVTYGNGVVSALQAAKTLREEHGVGGVTVIDAPYLSSVPEGLRQALAARQGASVVFADVCKAGQSPLATHAVTLQNEGALMGRCWRLAAAQPTYNPLGSFLTFLNEDDIVKAVLEVARAYDDEQG